MPAAGWQRGGCARQGPILQGPSKAGGAGLGRELGSAKSQSTREVGDGAGLQG